MKLSSFLTITSGCYMTKWQNTQTDGTSVSRESPGFPVAMRQWNKKFLHAHEDNYLTWVSFGGEATSWLSILVEGCLDVMAPPTPWCQPLHPFNRTYYRLCPHWRVNTRIVRSHLQSYCGVCHGFTVPPVCLCIFQQKRRVTYILSV